MTGPSYMPPSGRRPIDAQFLDMRKAARRKALGQHWRKMGDGSGIGRVSATLAEIHR